MGPGRQCGIKTPRVAVEKILALAIFFSSCLCECLPWPWGYWINSYFVVVYWWILIVFLSGCQPLQPNWNHNNLYNHMTTSQHCASQCVLFVTKKGLESRLGRLHSFRAFTHAIDEAGHGFGGKGVAGIYTVWYSIYRYYRYVRIYIYRGKRCCRDFCWKRFFNRN